MTEVTDRDMRLARMVKRTDGYVGLWVDPRFQEWKKNVVDKRLADLREKGIIKGDVQSDVGRRLIEANILANKIISGMFDEFFNEMQMVNEHARDEQKIIKENHAIR